MRRPSILLAVVLLVAGGAACPDSNGDGGPAPPTTTSTAASATTSIAPVADEAAVRVYFARDEKVAVAGRAVEAPAVARGAMEALLSGPDDFEAGLGMTSAVPTGTELLGVSITAGDARVDLSGDFASGGGSLSMQMRVAQVVFTLTQFPTVDRVTILLDGEEATEGIGGEGVPAVEVDRSDSEDVTPFVLVESPVPGETVSSPLEVVGIANTFEANVRFQVADGGGTVLDEGFTTASGGQGVWSEFRGTLDFEVGSPGPGTVTAFQDSARTGEPIDVYDVPVELT